MNIFSLELNTNAQIKHTTNLCIMYTGENVVKTKILFMSRVVYDVFYIPA